MLRKWSWIHFLLLLFAVSIFFGSCKKEVREFDLNPNLNAANDIVLGETSYQYAFIMLCKAVKDPNLPVVHYALIDSSLVLFDPAQNLYTFQFIGKMGADSIRRYGIFKAQPSGDLMQQGTTGVIHYNNFSQDIFQVGGIDTIVNSGTDGQGRLVFTTHSDSTAITKEGGLVARMKIKADFYVTFSVPGPETVYIDFISEGTSSKGYPFTCSTAQQLIYRSYCPWTDEGVLSFSVPSAAIPDGTISFKDISPCNDTLIYNIDGNIFRYRQTYQYLRN
jgi:hypothetical protein